MEFLNLVKPERWPEPPTEMTVSSLLAIERCPRSWALKFADFDAIWKHKGYPPRIHIPALLGNIVHNAIGTITAELAKTGCSSLMGPESVAVMKSLGGYDSLFEKCIEQVLKNYIDNPRSAHLIDNASQVLRNKIPEMRIHVQRLLSRLQLNSSFQKKYGITGTEKRRHLMGDGYYPELDIKVPDLKWKGRVDLLVITDGKPELFEFKTGKMQDHHLFQLRVYALLWSRDPELNPEKRLAQFLTLNYGSNVERIPGPTISELELLIQELNNRTGMARAALTCVMPNANLDSESCQYCDVRHLCDDYWKSSIPVITAKTREDSSLWDVEILIGSRQGPTSWIGHVISSFLTKDDVVIRTPKSTRDLNPGEQLRILGAQVTWSDEDRQNCLISATSATEIFNVA
jgi:hypothetical protein